MANKLLLPGFGGQYQSETFSVAMAGSTGTDRIDCSHCAQLAVTVASTSPVGLSFELQHSFDGGTTFTRLGSIISTAGNTLFDVTDGPFGLVRLNSLALTSGSYFVAITGFPIQRMF